MWFNLPSFVVWATALSSAAAWKVPPHAPRTFYKGHDLSSVKLLEDSGITYKDTARHNETRPVEDILGDGGMNGVRLRIWVNPVDGTYDLQYTLDLASRFFNKGYDIYLDFHFSDTWADPNHQYPPAAWPTTLSGASSTIRTYVKNTLISFSNAGIDLSLVSLGNEIRHGILWPLGYVDVDTEPTSARIANFTNLAHLWSSARKGVNDAIAAGVSKPEVMIHIDDGWNVTLQTLWFEALTGSGIVHTTDWDVFGFSFYPFYGSAATYANLRTSLNTLARQYAKPLQVVETDWPDICSGIYEPKPNLSEPEIPVSVSGQIDWVRGIEQVVEGVPGGLGRGVWYWEPAWLNNTGLGSACDDTILFSTDWTNYPDAVGYSRRSVDMFQR